MADNMPGESPEENLSYLSGRIDGLSERLERIEKRLGIEKPAAPAPEPKIEPSGPNIQPTATAEAAPAGQTDAAAETAPKPAGDSIETKIGMKYANWIGIFALIIGAGFFLKYAIDNDWIGETGRVVMGILGGLILIAAGHFAAARKFRGPAFGLMGGGLAILYLSVLAAFQFYHLISQATAFGFFVLITVIGITLAVRYSAAPIAALALIGGFLTPVMLSTGTDNQIFLFSYMAILDIGILATAYFKRWRFLDYLAFFFTICLFEGWAQKYYLDEKLFRTEFFLSLFFLIFAFLSFFYNIINRKKTSPNDLLLLIGVPGIYYGASLGLLWSGYRDYMGLFTLLMTGLYMLLARLAQSRNREDKYLVLLLLGIALTFLTLVIPIQLSHKWITIAWTVQAAALIWIGFRTGSLATRIGGLLILLVLVLIRLSCWESGNVQANGFTAVINERFITFLVALTGFLASAYIYAKRCAKDSDERKAVLIILMLYSVGLGFWMITMETVAWYKYCGSTLPESMMLRTLSVEWAVYALMLLIIGIARKSALVRWLSFLMFGMTIAKVFFFDLSELEPIYRITSFLILGVILIAVSFLYQKFYKRLQN
ncbi:MAG: DUF2339 domain-containing protein [Planctomycetota bacterium]